MRAVGHWLTFPAVLACTALSACNVYDPSLIARGEWVHSVDAGTPDTTISTPNDAAVSDATFADADLPDATPADAAIDSAIADAQAPDAESVDASADDAASQDAATHTPVDAHVPLTCPAMRGDCNDDPSDGCETDLSREPNCGQCNRVCEKLPFLHTCRHADDPATGQCMRAPCQCCNQLQGCE